MPVQCTCLQCGKTYFRKPSTVGPYCSRACNGRRKRIDTPSICETCGKEFPVLFNRDLKRRFCSKRCWALAYRESNRQLTIERNRVWSDEETAYLIEHYPIEGGAVVSAAIGKTKAQVRDKVRALKLTLTTETRHATGGAAISRSMTSNNPMRRPDVRVKVYERAKNNPTSLELRLATMLTEMGILFEPQCYIKRFRVDFRIGSLIIEADGDWWHGHPRFQPLNPMQLANQGRDRARNAYLTACGYTVVRIWESDLTADLLTRVLAEHQPATTLFRETAMRPCSGQNAVCCL